ncbi:uncharacterized protein N7483_007255 [Penicillium malachiteum]|uniref:uncharacterized protein n=1 Tax=Penicillium malachiteum TaxID=1324776 RepID=UPI002549B9D2|nr:uncharacterized protein N7483_007255 [Penicillium malachiteum]KAJ5725898.1 hypothetical protein N7483_007255 [Penicillium malachiteum]
MESANLPYTQKTPLNTVWRDNADPAIYEAARTSRLFNAQKPTQYPIAIAFVKDASEVVDVIQLAIQLSCRISVRAGGHSYASWSVRDEAILIDMGDFSENPSLDEATGIVSIPPSIMGKDLIEYLDAKGRVCSVGHCPDVGLGGFLLGGGMGWNCNVSLSTQGFNFYAQWLKERKNWGWACEQVVAIDVVTADGQFIRSDIQQHSDLFWAARGAGPAFPGVVTRFYLKTKPAIKSMFSSGYVYPIRSYRTSLQWAATVSSSNDGIEVLAIGSYSADLKGPCVTVSILAYGDNDDDARDVLQKIDASHPNGALLQWICEKTNMQQQLEKSGQSFPNNHRYYVDNLWLDDNMDFSLLDRAFNSLPTKNSLLLCQSMFPCSQRDLPDMALSLQSNQWLAMYAIWEEEADDSRCETAVHEAISELQQHSKGSYLGELDFRARRGHYWADDQYERLVSVRRKWDPLNRICGCLGLEV